MTLAQIMTLALRQLDEDAQDIAEYDDAFRVYANIGYAIAVKEHLKPKAYFALRTDQTGRAALKQEGIVRVVEVQEKGSGREVRFQLGADGETLLTQARNAELSALCEVSYPELTEGTDEPRLPGQVHHALADYICYRHLCSGSLAKQSRAQVFLSSFCKAMALLRPQGMGSVKGYKNLYTVTEANYVP